MPFHIPGTKSSTNPEVSAPLNPRPINANQPMMPVGQASDSTFATQPPTMAPTVPPVQHGLVNMHPDLAHVARPDANQPAGAMNPHDPKLGIQAGQMPASVPPPTYDPNMVSTEKNTLPFKEQVKAYAKVHRGTILGDHEQKELGKKILAGEEPPR